ncbi:vitamin K epoxide reductase family protein [Streptomyces aidingensis]|uniref:Uncharacterized membrane protein n=1 Tax=Streptomyces aidingensis TaxID=910347 RepID=A0A1I1S381_9ACTN|nr:vitamin K epoxide reductase family protein [Streptomyces aidingensis]SFD37410.1 Uncharacterized membrane protein [Streptomyces aidingensis]
MTTTADLDDMPAEVPAQRRKDEAQQGGPAGTGASRPFALMLVITGFLGLLASWVIIIDKLHLAENENYQPACSINPVVSCGSVMTSDQAEVFGFPNPMLGMAAYASVITIGMALLAGARYRAWFWRGLLAGTAFGVGFCTWLMYQSLYNIGALCLWCNLVWVVTAVMFWYTVVHTVRHGFVRVPEGLRRGLLEFHWVPATVHIGIIGMLILTRWWDFWF